MHTEYPVPVDLSFDSPVEEVAQTLATLRLEEISRIRNGTPPKASLSSLLVEQHRMIEEARWLDPETAVPLAWEFVRTVVANQPVNREDMPIPPESQASFFSWMFDAGVFNTDEQHALADIWKQTLLKVSDPWSGIRAKIRYVGAVEQEEERGRLMVNSWQETKQLLAAVRPTGDFSYRQFDVLSELFWFAKASGSPVADEIDRYLYDRLRDGSFSEISVDALSSLLGLVAGTFRAKERADALLWFVEDASHARISASVHELLSNGSRGVIGLIDDEPVPLGFLTGFCTWEDETSPPTFDWQRFRRELLSHHRIRLHTEPPVEAIDQVVSDITNHDLVIAELADYRISEGQRKQALAYWGAISDPYLSTRVYAHLAAACLINEDFALFGTVNTAFTDRWQTIMDGETLNDVLGYPFDQYVFESLVREELPKLFLLPVIDRIIRRDPFACDGAFIRLAHKDGQGTVAYEFAKELLSGEVEKLSAGSVIQTLRHLLWWKTHSLGVTP